jgi:hypothetical protein
MAVMPRQERELVSPVDLCLPDGRLNPDAVGWTRTPLHRSNLRGWGRHKRWEYWGIVTPRHIVGVVLSSLDYLGLLGVYVLDRETGQESAHDAVVPLARGIVLPERSGAGAGRAFGRGGGVRVEIRDADDGTTGLRAAAPGVELDVTVPRAAGHESLGVVVPWDERRFQYTVKDLGRRVSRGTLRLGAVTHDVGDAYAVLDHGRGRWPREVTWNWAAGVGGAGGLAVQLGGKWTDGTGSTENAVFVDGRLHKISAELDWRYDRSDWMRGWEIRGDGVEVDFAPFHERVSRTDLRVLASETHQCFGGFSGRVRVPGAGWVPVDGLTGWAEEAHNRW